jgi:hypothetical protein
MTVASLEPVLCFALFSLAKIEMSHERRANPFVATDMNELTPGNVHAFLKRFQLKGGRLIRISIRPRRGEATTAELRLTALETTTSQPVRLRMTFTGVEEYRFQRRPSAPLVRLKEVQIGFFGTLAYVNLDAFPEEGPPKIMDFRASDCFLAGRIVSWEVVEKK